MNVKNMAFPAIPFLSASAELETDAGAFEEENDLFIDKFSLLLSYIFIITDVSSR